MGGWDWKILQIKFYIVSIHLISLIYFKELLCGLAKAATTSTEQEEDSGQRCCGDGWWRHDKTDPNDSSTLGLVHRIHRRWCYRPSGE
uniref:Uncharacterized protein n=1 Tax=Oryza punctata TaxID=4537 RepID=A0A0E0JV82_ORYPU